MEESEYTDHDLLIIIAERTRVGGQRLEDLDRRLTKVERYIDRQSGFLAGGRWVWALLAALPPGAVVLIFGLS